MRLFPLGPAVGIARKYLLGFGGGLPRWQATLTYRSGSVFTYGVPKWNS